MFTDTSLEITSAVRDIIQNKDKKTSNDAYFSAVRSVNLACICLTDALTMYSLAVSIKITLGTITLERSTTLHRLAYTLATVFILSYIILEIIIIQEGKTLRHFVRMMTNATLLIVSAAILLYLKDAFNQFGAHNTQSAIRSIVTQFVVFLIAYFLLMCESIWKIYFEESAPLWQHQIFSFYHKVVILVPLNYVIYIHRKTFE